MTLALSRRRILAAAGSLASLLPFAAGRAGAAAPAGPIALAVRRRTIAVHGKPASVFGIAQPDGTTGLFLDPGQRFDVTLRNEAGEPTIIHWHGQTPPPDQDGVTEFGIPPLAADTARAYDFAPRPGTHWMHSHYGLQEQMLMAAPLIVRTAEDLRADEQEVSVLLHDFTFRDPAELLAGLRDGTGQHGGMAMGGVTHGAAVAPHSGMAVPGMRHGNIAAMDLNEVDYDAYLANDRALDDPLVVRTERGGRVRLRLINGATATAFWIDLGDADATLRSVDGNPVRPLSGRRFPLAPGQRLDLVLRVPAGRVVPVLAQREGDRQRTGLVLAAPGAPVRRIAQVAPFSAGPIDLSLEQRLIPLEPLRPRAVDTALRVTLTGSMSPYVWTIDDRAWGEPRALQVRKSQRVALEMVNRSPMAHPMHLHGHHFQVVALNGRKLAGAMRDTVLVPVGGSVTIAFDADNPGRWLLHCHNLLHMAAGMMTELAYHDAA